MGLTRRLILAGLAVTQISCEPQIVMNANAMESNTEIFHEVTKGIVIRAGQCSTIAFKAGAEQKENGKIQSLSVNCTTATDNVDDYKQYLAGIDHYSHFCVAKWEKLKLANISVLPAPIQGNSNHCLLSGNVGPAVAKFSPKE